VRISWFVDQIPALVRVFFGAPAVMQPAQLLGRQRRLLVGVVLAAVSMHRNKIASLWAVATIAIPCPRRARPR